VLAYELRIAIDRAQRLPRYLEAVYTLVEENPRGTASSHVRHNLGARRRAWLVTALGWIQEAHSLQMTAVYRILEAEMVDGVRHIKKVELITAGIR
jgi:hypothetical protein